MGLQHLIKQKWFYELLKCAIVIICFHYTGHRDIFYTSSCRHLKLKKKLPEKGFQIKKCGFVKCRIMGV